jgi:hypothetical protein
VSRGDAEVAENETSEALRVLRASA